MKKAWLLFSLLILAVLIAACTKTNTNLTEDDCSAFNGSAKDNCYAESLKCSKITELSTRDSCVAELAKAKKDLAVCNLIKDGKTKGYCQEQIALILKDHGICNQIDDLYWEDNCHGQLAVANNQSNYCALVSDEAQRGECFKTIAYATNDYLLCEQFSGTDEVSCLTKIAKSLLSPEPCLLIENSVYHDSCLYNVAKKSNRIEVCHQLKVNLIRQQCLEMFNATASNGSITAIPAETDNDGDLEIK